MKETQLSYLMERRTERTKNAEQRRSRTWAMENSEGAERRRSTVGGGGDRETRERDRI
ncbi:hypothetical protein SESBI_27507 [Sesbania bispinosa]|nr:hypothetical protein SESBI_27507 [Sesbania bispinosa]